MPENKATGAHPRARRVLTWIGIAVTTLFVVALLTLSLIDLNVVKHPIERFASARSGRNVVIAGPLQAHIWSWTPDVTINGLTVGNPPWEAARPMLQAQRVQVRVRLLPLLTGRVIVDHLEMDNALIYLHRDASGRANWTFENQKPTNEPAGPPTRFPVVRNLIIASSQLTLEDEILHLDVEATLQARENASANDPRALRIEGKGTVNRQPLTVQVLGSPLIAVDPGRPYPFALRIAAGNIQIDADGLVHEPFDLGRIGLVVRASGDDLADFYYLTQLAFPNTPPFRMQASIERDGSQVHVDPIAGQVGESDVRGQLSIDISRKRPTVTGELLSKKLRLSDLAESLGGKPMNAAAISREKRSLSAKERPQRKPRAPPATAAPEARLFPEARLQVNRVRAMNADVSFTAVSINAGSLPLKKVALHIKLNDGVLSLDPFEFQMPEGKLRGTANVDARGITPETHLDIRMTDIQLSQFKGKSPGATPPLAGDVQARVLTSGRGDSVHDFVADANGTVTFVLPHGEINSALVELTGINVAEGLGLLLKGGKDRADIRCGVAQFAVQDGTMRAQQFVLDTQNVRITGSGDVRLGPEELDLSLKGDPKKLRLTRLKAPVKISGHLLKPTISISASQALKQGAIATALGATLTPLAAVIAFVDPGLARDENCAALLAAAENSPGAPKP
jgi:uncharacterized protein involved in outer membrane biogenesis